jgi:hypothetical protein
VFASLRALTNALRFDFIPVVVNLIERTLARSEPLLARLTDRSSGLQDKVGRQRFCRGGLRHYTRYSGDSVVEVHQMRLL